MNAKIMGWLMAIVLGALVSGCDQRPAVDQWEYEVFQFSKIHRDETNIKWATAVYLKGELDPATYSRKTISTNICYNVSEALNFAGKYGWEMAVFDGTNYVLKRRITKESSKNGIMISLIEMVK